MSASSWEDNLRSLGGYENELLSIPAGGVRKLIAEYAAVEQQLDEAQKQIVLLRTALKEIYDHGLWRDRECADEALDATDNLKDCILCDAEPVAWIMDTTHKASGEKSTWISTDPKGWTQMASVIYGEQSPLHKARTK